ncbi:MAG: hypothetical protein PHP22_07655 [Oscillospiraceae bacterium]|nr:hypothetical protein [Oscillospiraceae bacterium]
MSSMNEFTISFPKGAIRFELTLMLFIILFPVMFTVTGQETHVVMYVSFGLLALCLGGLPALHMITHKIRVNRRSIQVRKGLFRKFSIDVTQINRVDGEIANTVFGTLNTLMVRAGSRKFKVNVLMEVEKSQKNGASAMLAYLIENIDESKIHITTHNPMNLK